ncbi:Protein-glutamate methylesterase/protein-glutamine glutaminase [Streptomyces badius]
MDKTRTPPLRPTYSRRVSGAYGRVLVVDDNKVIRQLIRVNLELEGFEVVTAADGVEALDLVGRVRPDAITLDVVMPRLDGLETATRLRSDPRTRDLPIAVISACTPYEVDAGVAAGVDAFLAKPFEPSELVRIMRLLVTGEEEPSADGRRGAGRAGSPAGGPACRAGPDRLPRAVEPGPADRMAKPVRKAPPSLTYA